MADDALPLDGAIAAFLTDVLDDLVGLVDNEEAIQSTLTRLGVEGVDADSLVAHLLEPAQQSAISELRDGLPTLLQELTKPNPNLISLIEPVKNLVEAVTGLARDPSLPSVSLPAVPDVDAGSVLDVLLAMAVERTLQAKTAAGWSVAKALHLVGPELPISTVLSDLVDSPLDFVWRRFNALRRHLDITIAGVITGPRTLSVTTVPIAPSDSIDATVRAAVPDADVILQRITLRLAADTYDASHAFTIEALGHGAPGGGLPDFAAV